jgi:hypothetical protein
MVFSERELGRVIKRWLEENEFVIQDKGKRPYETRFKVYLNKPVQTQSKKFKEFWESNLDVQDIPLSQPEIDLIAIDKYNTCRAIELKAIKKKKELISPSYYFGVGQALAYLAYGMDEVALWQCSDGKSMTDEEISDYYRALTRLWTPIEHLLDVTYLKITIEKQKSKIQTATFRNREKCRWSDGIGIHDLETGKYIHRGGSSNPFRLGYYTTSEGIPVPFNTDIVNRVNTIREFLERQKIDVWDKKT